MAGFTVKIMGTAKGFVAACKQAVTEAKISSKKIKQEFDKAKQGAASTGGPAGGAAGKLFSAGGMAAMGPAAAGAAALTATIAAGTAAYELYRKSVQEASEASLANAKAVEQAADSKKKLMDADQNAMTQLITLSNTEELSNVQRLEACKIIDQLNSRYKNLGITIDDITSKNGKLHEAEGKMARAQIEARKKDIERQLAQNRGTRSDLEFQRDSAGVKIWGTNMQIGGEADAKSAQEKISAIVEKDIALRKELNELNKKNPEAEAKALADAKKADASEKAKKQADDLEQKQNSSVQNALENARRNAEYQDMKNKGLERELAIQKAIDALADKKGGYLTDDEISQMEQIAGNQFDADAAAKLAKLEADSLKDFEQKFKIQQLICAGKLREAEIQKAINDAEAKNGAPLSDEQRKTVAERAGILYDNDPNRNKGSAFQSAPNQSAITNNLIRIGANAAFGAINRDYDKQTLDAVNLISRTCTNIYNARNNADSSKSVASWPK